MTLKEKKKVVFKTIVLRRGWVFFIWWKIKRWETRIGNGGEEGRETSFNSNIISRKLSRNVFAKDVSYKEEYYVGFFL